MSILFFFFSSRRRHTRLQGDWSSDVCSSDLPHTEDRPRLRTLTPRQRELLELIALGRDNVQIAAVLGLREKSVRNHITRIFAALEVENRAQAIVLAREAGYGAERR